MSTYHDGSRRLQDRFDTRRLADRIDEKLVSRGRIDDDDRAFIERCDMVFVATADAEGRPNCSYKGGEPGFVRVLDERTIALPSYDGNGMYLSEDDPLGAEYPGAQFVVRVRAEQVFPNCPRYIHHYQLVARSRFVPKADCEAPVPGWKTREWSRDALPENDPARDPEREVVERG